MADNRPNIIFYFTDQQRADTCGCYGQKLDITPRLDQMASEGVKFEWAFSPQPVCGPCRALFQTGKYPTETGCFRNNVMLPANVKTLGSYIEEAGQRWRAGEEADDRPYDHRDSSGTARRLYRFLAHQRRAGVHFPWIRRLCV